MQNRIKRGDKFIDFEELGITSAKITRKKSATDEFSATMLFDKCKDLFSIGDWIEVYSDKTRKFAGFITSMPETHTVNATKISIIVKSAWYDLERIIYQQEWKSMLDVGNSTILQTTRRSKLHLGQSSIGNKISSATQILEILQYAISKGAQIQIGGVYVDIAFPMEEAKDLSCAEAIARVMKWIPNASVYLDYSCDGFPKIYIKTLSQMKTAQLDLQSECVKSINVASRPDLQTNAVSIKYELEYSDGISSWTKLAEDNYPQDADYGGKNAIVMSVELAGLRQTCQVYEISCETIQPTSPQWWKNLVPALSDAEDLEILEYALKEDSSKLPRRLVSGTINSAMNFVSEKEKISAVLKYTNSNGDILKKKIGAEFISTNAVSGTYYIRRTTQYAEPIPSGLARAIYESANALQYDGYTEVLGASAENFIGCRLNVLGGNLEWTTMLSPVVSTIEDLQSGVLKIKFGVPEHLYSSKISEMFRINRYRKPPTYLDERSSGVSASNKIYFSGDSAGTNGSQGDVLYSKFVMQGGDTQGVVSLDVAELNEGECAKLREIYVCKDGKLALAKALLTEPQFVD